jgi:hypothetical protein
MTTNRKQRQRGAPQRPAADGTQQRRLERRRADMQAAEGHAGSIPRGNQRPEEDSLGTRQGEWERLLGH